MKILVADDHALFISGLSLILKDLSKDPVIETTDSYDGLLKKARNPFDLILIDVAMPGGPLQSALTELIHLQPQTPTVLLSAITDKNLIKEAFKLGVKGFIPKTSSSSLLINALKLILDGGTYLPPELLGDMQEGGNEDISPESVLTPRQQDVLKLLSLGKSNKEIAILLKLSEGTVKLHVTAILRALDVSNRTEAVIKAGGIK